MARLAIGDATLVVDGKVRARPRLAPCKRCGRAPELSTGYVREDGTPPSPEGYGPFLLKCDHGRTDDDDENREFYFVRSWNYDRAIAMWQRGNGGKVRRRDLKRRRRKQRNARARARGWRP